jgi:2-methylisocitrate lyase-like PEP mutase family enzyme
MLTRMADTRDRFRELHARDGVFVMPNAWDLGSARLLVSLGFEALATTSSGHAWSLGKDDHAVTLDELVDHVAALAGAVGVPISVDSEQLFADPVETVRALAEAGASGCSVEDYDAAGRQDDLAVAVERVGAAAEAAHRDGLVLTARCESHLFPDPNLDETIARLAAYRDAGEIRAVVEAVGVPVNVLARPNGPSVPELEALGVRRVSTGGALASAAYAAMLAGARELLGPGTSEYARQGLTPADKRAF